MTSEPAFREQHGQQSKQAQSGVIIGVCPSCQQAVTHTNEQLLRSRGEMSLSYGSCLSCQMPLFTFTIGSGVVHTSIGVCTDLQQIEIEKFWSRTTVTEEEILSLHELLNKPQSTHYFTHNS